jgi:hypothetical protein
MCSRGGEEVDGDIQGAAAGVIGDALGGFTLNVVFAAGKTGKGGKKLKEREQGVTDMVVEGGFEAF